MESNLDPTVISSLDNAYHGNVDNYLLNNDPTAVDSTMNDPTAVVTKKRKPIVKLTAERLLSDNGLPYVMKNARKRIHISKNKSPCDNFNNILLFYQLWAHNLYPKAKFKDFIKLAQGLGKSDKILREYRSALFRKEMGLIDDDELNRLVNFLQNNDEVIPIQEDSTHDPNAVENNADATHHESSILDLEQGNQPQKKHLFEVNSDLSDADEEDQIYNVTRPTTEDNTITIPLNNSGNNEEEALLLEMEEQQAGITKRNAKVISDDEEELELLKDFEMEQQKLETHNDVVQEHMEEDEMELMRGM
ncbi:hypothetical protein TPHA_0C02500 [Tetrapisispora phaffii CBS 4417]|uniref:Chromosome segregation in meiosis protein n=1 Tax=Tetrapisispora phaffii (strain ATCC 24235 / CBS 4417 / NBRC 1672 / NRRL Y-8282 / UCD 70-5) TaxID=1071381 RepID=G8BRM7_TETPH|nr:hypothetical protein TPHA_0C02500 [Tetrapisispora phaffii CBS 4417]CCE62403.1 hypothetical protein TPHA_0C02500 [Tetrapisispora phaffii CBS 4417]